MQWLSHQFTKSTLSLLCGKSDISLSLLRFCWRCALASQRSLSLSLAFPLEVCSSTSDLSLSSSPSLSRAFSVGCPLATAYCPSLCPSCSLYSAATMTWYQSRVFYTEGSTRGCVFWSVRGCFRSICGLLSARRSCCFFMLNLRFFFSGATTGTSSGGKGCQTGGILDFFFPFSLRFYSLHHSSQGVSKRRVSKRVSKVAGKTNDKLQLYKAFSI